LSKKAIIAPSNRLIKLSLHKIKIAMATFTDFDLPKSLQKALDELGFVNPTPIQERAMPVILSGRDMMGIAQTGTGKTFAYLLPILKHWKFLKIHVPRVVIIVPTRELVVQVAEEVEKLTKYMSVRTLGIYGGVNINTQKTRVYEGVDILVGTPGRMMDLALDNVVRFDEVQKLVIDEFDEILNLGFRVQITSIFNMMKAKRQNILFSATMTEDVDDMLNDYFDFPEEVSLAPSGTPLDQIEQLGYHVPNFLTKINLLKNLLEDESYSRILVFVNNKKTADLVMDSLEEDHDGQFGVIHSNKSQNYRLSTMAQFQNGELRGIVTTDVMARGLDISDITHVINMEFPEVPEQYIHRIGRTGRADKTGIAISFIAPGEQDIQVEAEVLMEKELRFLELPEGLEIAERLLEFEKDKKKMKVLMRAPKKSDDGAFHEKKEKNKKVNLGGPGKTKPRKTKPTNRGVERARDAKRKKKDK
jgi:ATP-dependent RNA helicase RhlE